MRRWSVNGLTALMAWSMAGSASAAGGVILDRSSLAADAGCRQGTVQWLRGGNAPCADTMPGRDRPEPAAQGPRRAGGLPPDGAEARGVEGRRQILQQELMQERARLASLLGASREPGGAEALQRARQDVLALERELARLRP